MQARPLVRPRRQALLETRAAQKRSALTPSESLLWSAIKAQQLGTTFRRQMVLGGGFICDFVAPARRVVVEVDGPWHARRRAGDARRDRKLARLGYRVLRLDAELVLGNLPEAVARVRAALGEPP